MTADATIALRRDALAECALLSCAGSRTIDALAAASTIRRVRAGQVLFLQGDRADAAYVVAEGLVRIEVTTAEGRELSLGLLQPGDSFGELAVLDGGTRSASALAARSAVVVRLPGAVLREAILKDPNMVSHLFSIMGQLVRTNAGHVAEIAFFDLERRIAKRVLDLMDTPLAAAITQTELARLVAASRQSVNQSLQRLQRRGLLRLRGGRLELVDATGLRQLLEGESR